jgi:DNA repair photolyase
LQPAARALTRPPGRRIVAPVPVLETAAKSLLRRARRVDAWFLSRAGLNLYRGCAHDCAFCDGRAEGYYVEGEFGRDVQAKTNAIDLLRTELPSLSRRAPSGFLLLGGGVGDSWQPAERGLLLARRALEALEPTALPVHVLTRSTLVLRDLDVLERLAATRRVLVSISFSGVDDRTAEVLEPGAPRPSERLRALETVRARGLAAGVFLMPLLPHITDGDAALGRTLRALQGAGAQYAVPAGLTLKDGRQKDHYLRVVGARRPDLAARYEALYTGDRWGRPAGGRDPEAAVLPLLRAHGIPPRIPRRLFEGVLDDRDLVTVLLQHLDVLARAEGRRTQWWRAAKVLADSPEPVHRALLAGALPEEEAAVVREILRTRTCSEYERLLALFTAPDRAPSR